MYIMNNNEDEYEYEYVFEFVGHGCTIKKIKIENKSHS